MSVAVCIDEIFLEHRAPAGHPERPDRLRAIAKRLTDSSLLDGVRRVTPRPATLEELSAAHARPFLEMLAARLPGESGYLDPDTYFSPRSWEAALSAAGALVDATRLALAGEVRHAAVFARPPGHHAESQRSMGFCLINPVATAAACARSAGARRIAIVDWDVHHGNGTQQIFWQDPNVLYLSVHQYPFYPGTGASDEIGEGAGRGATINVPLPAGMGNLEYARVFEYVFVPALRAFEPEVILVSAGYDAHRDDPLGQMELDAAGYADLTTRLAALGRPLVLTLEGGYDLAATAESVAATLERLEHPQKVTSPPVGKTGCAPQAERACHATVQALAGTPLAQALVMT